MGGDLIPGPQSAGMIQTPDITSSYRCVFVQEGLSGPPSLPHEHMHIHTPIQGHQRARVSEQRESIRVDKGDPGGTKLERPGGGATPLALCMSWLRFFSPGSQCK